MACKATGRLVIMLVKRYLSRTELVYCAALLHGAADMIEEITREKVARTVPEHGDAGRQLEQGS